MRCPVITRMYARCDERHVRRKRTLQQLDASVHPVAMRITNEKSSNHNCHAVAERMDAERAKVTNQQTMIFAQSRSLLASWYVSD